MALIVLDASVLIAWLDPQDGLHSAATAALLGHAADDLKIPASAYSESLVGPARSGRLAAATAAVAPLGEIVPLGGRVAEEAARLRARHPRLRLPDALVIATGTALGAAAVLTGDAAWRGLASSVQVVT